MASVIVLVKLQKALAVAQQQLGPQVRRRSDERTAELPGARGRAGGFARRGSASAPQQRRRIERSWRKWRRSTSACTRSSCSGSSACSRQRYHATVDAHAAALSRYTHTLTHSCCCPMSLGARNCRSVCAWKCCSSWLRRTYCCSVVCCTGASWVVVMAIV